ncbi:hypothetical protein ACQP3F_34840, partial [Escherichia coli]
VAGYKINSKNQWPTYTQMMKWLRKKSENQHPFKQPQIIYFCVILTKRVKNLYNKNSKSLKNEIGNDIEDGKISHAH